MILPLLFFASILSASAVTVAASLTPPVPIRECFTQSNKTVVSLISPFATLIESEPPHNVPPFHDNQFGTHLRRTISGVCLELLTLNNDVFFPIAVDGAGLAHTAMGIAEKCGGLGWGYYTDRRTGNTFHGELYAVLQECSEWYPRSGGTRVICPTDTTGEEKHDPKLPCPGEEE